MWLVIPKKGAYKEPIKMYISIVSNIIETLGYNNLIDGCYDLGVYALELAIPDDLLHNKNDLELLFEKLKSNRIKVAAVTWGDMLPNEEVADIAQIIFKSRYLEKRMIKLMPPHHTKPEVPDEKYAKQTAKNLKLILDKTQEIGVELTLENHGAYDRPLGVKKEFLDLVLRDVHSDRFGICLDTGCFYWYYPLDEYYRVTRHFLPYVNHVHLKNQTFPPGQRYKYKAGVPVSTAHDNLYEGDINLERVIDMLKGVGYDEDLCIEDHSIWPFLKSGASISEARKVIRRDIEFLESVL